MFKFRFHESSEVQTSTLRQLSWCSISAPWLSKRACVGGFWYPDIIFEHDQATTYFFKWVKNSKYCFTSAEHFILDRKKRAFCKKKTINRRLIFHSVYWARMSFLWWPWCSKSRSFVVCLISRGQPTIYPRHPLCPALPIKDVSSEVYLPAKVDMWSHVVREHMCLSSTLWSQAWQLRSCCQN